MGKSGLLAMAQILALASASPFAATDYSSLCGYVAFPDGSPAKNVTVSLSSSQTDSSYSGVTNSEGYYSLSASSVLDISIPVKQANVPTISWKNGLLSLSLGATAPVSVIAYDLLGNHLKTIENKTLSAGSYSYKFDRKRQSAYAIVRIRIGKNSGTYRLGGKTASSWKVSSPMAKSGAQSSSDSLVLSYGSSSVTGSVSVPDASSLMDTIFISHKVVSGTVSGSTIPSVILLTLNSSDGLAFTQNATVGDSKYEADVGWWLYSADRSWTVSGGSGASPAMASIEADDAVFTVTLDISWSGCAETTDKTPWAYLNSDIAYETMTDERDCQTYKTVVIGTQTWMAENLNYGTQIAGADEESDDAVVEKYCGKESADYCAYYGGLYQWAEAMGLGYAYNSAVAVANGNARGICPSGWHVPTSAEWKTLSANFSDSTGYHLKSKADNTWATNPSTSLGGPGDDLAGFSGTAGGGRYYSGYVSGSGTADATNYFGWCAKSAGGTGFRGLFYTATNSADSATVYHLGDDQTGLGSEQSPKIYGFSIRCVKD